MPKEKEEKKEDIKKEELSEFEELPIDEDDPEIEEPLPTASLEDVMGKPVIDENKVIQTIIFGADWQEVLTTLVAEEGMDPLDIDLTKLADSFMVYLQKVEKFDFRIPARFILVAAILLRMKTELLLEEEEKKVLRQGEQIAPINIDNIPPLTAPMVRKPTRAVTLNELVSALNKAFAFQVKKEGKEIRLRKAVERLIEPEEDIEAKIEKVYGKVVKAHKIMFSQLVPAWRRIEIVETFLPLLYLSMRSKLTMDQQEMFQDITVTLVEEQTSPSQ